jgi:hypothetical protein
MTAQTRQAATSTALDLIRRRTIEHGEILIVTVPAGFGQAAQRDLLDQIRPVLERRLLNDVIVLVAERERVSIESLSAEFAREMKITRVMTTTILNA